MALTPLQEGLLFHYLKDPAGEYYFEQLSLEISGAVGISLFEKAWNFVVAANRMLRTVFRWEKTGNPTQIVLKDHRVRFEYHDLCVEADGLESTGDRLEAVKKADRDEKFDLREVPFRVTLCRIAQNRHEMILSSHHILFDGWSTGIILTDFFNAYKDLCAGEIPVKPVRTSFKEFIRRSQNQDTQEQETYWKDYLEGVGPDERTELPVKRRYTPSGQNQNFAAAFAKHGFRIPFDRSTENLDNRITPAVLVYGAWGILLQRYVNRGDAIFGTSVSGRSVPVEGIEDIVGLFINTVPLRFNAGISSESRSLEDILVDLSRSLRAREAYETTPLVKIHQYCGCEAGVELFDSLVVVENYPLDIRRMGEGGPLEPVSYSMVESTHYDLTVVVRLTESIDVDFLYREEVFEGAAIRQLGTHFTRILRGIVENPGQEMTGFEFLSPDERRRILEDFNNTGVEYPRDYTLLDMFEQQAERTGDRIAVVGTTSITYKELHEKSGRIARLLRDKGVGQGDIAAVQMERSVEMVVVIFGILKAGAAYLPLDPGYPEERTQYILKDSNAGIFLSGSGELSELSGGFPEYSSQPDQLAYVIYTSGSTGKPKGVMVGHVSIMNTLIALQNRYPFGETDVYLLKTSYLFDVSVAEIFGWYLGGGRLAVLEAGGEKDPGVILDAVARMRVTHINFVPSMFSAFVDRLTPRNAGELSRLKYLFLAGEALLPGPINAFRRLNPAAALENLYGPTESSIYASWYSLSEWDGEGDIPIGKPLDNVKLFILDKKNRFQLVGVPGELVISGAGLARGYLNRPELTSEFFNKSHKTYKSYRTYSFYKTGDLARWREDGNIEFLGRIDNQVKVRGFRIELGEIENRLLNHAGVKETVVVAREDHGGDRYLCAYIVPCASFDPGDLRNYLGAMLPGYMVPSYFVELSELPRTATGKVSRRTLPEPLIKAGDKYTPPRDGIETGLAAIWEAILSHSPIGIDDNFFQLGGHSLRATRLLAAVYKEFGVKIEVRELFKAPTIRLFSSYLRTKNGTAGILVEPGEKREYYPLSSAQKRLFFEQRIDPGNTGYNIPVILELKGAVDNRELENALNLLSERHESLRTSFIMLEDGPVQVIHRRMLAAVEYFDPDYTDYADYADYGIGSTGECCAGAIKRLVRPFDLSRAPLLRVGVSTLAEDLHLLIMDTHHIISDGISETILVNEFVSLYRGETLPPPRLHYKDYSLWQHRFREEAAYLEQEAYWVGEFGDDIPRLHMPIDFPRPMVRSFEGEVFAFELSADESARLIELARSEGVTLFMVLLAIYNVFLSRVDTYNCDDIVVGVPAAGRRHADLNAVIGMFVNTLAIRCRPRGHKTFGEFLNEVEQKTLSAFENQDYQFEDLVNRVLPERDAGRNPLFDVMLTFNNWEDRLSLEASAAVGIRRLNLELMEYKTARFDLILHGFKRENVVRFIFEYSTRLYKKETVQRFAAYFKKVAAAVLKDSQKEISAIELIDDEEKRDLVRNLREKKSKVILEHIERNKDRELAANAASLSAEFDL